MSRLVESTLSSSKVSGRAISRRGFIPVDYLVLGYACFTSILLMMPSVQPADRVVWLLFNAIVTGGVIGLRRVDVNSDQTLVRILRRCYPILLFTLFYEQTQPLIHVFFTGWFDAQLVDFEIWILGFQPSLEVVDYYHPLLNEIIIACYVSYYLFLVFGVVGMLWKRREEVVDHMLTASVIAFIVSYVLFFLYPVEGPRHHLAEMLGTTMEGYVFVPLVHRIMQDAAVHGGAMPSSHTAVALIVLYYLFRHSKRLGVILSPITIGILVGCVWGEFHYISDVVVGCIIAVAAIWVAELMYRKKIFGSGRIWYQTG